MQERTQSTRAPAPGGLLESISTRLARMASQETVFGEPIQSHDTTIVPVATVRLGFGGGGGHKGEGEEGGGGGGGGVAIPVGFIEIDPEGARFRKIRRGLGTGEKMLLTALAILLARWLLRTGTAR
jgi:uncharacterized spore protein YtfJ